MRKIHLILFASIFLVSCLGDTSGFVNETPQYMRDNPDCIVGTYYNYFTDGAVSYIQLRKDSTYLHICKYENINYADSGRWRYEYNQGQNDIYFGYHFKRLQVEGEDKVEFTEAMRLVDCAALSMTEESEKQKLNFYKKSSKY